MKLVGLGGGIGAGKSSVSNRLRKLGAVIVDADLVARQVVEPGQPALAQLFERFGPSIVNDDGTLNRSALAGIAFNDADALKALNAITHPAIGDEMIRQIATQRRTDRVVIMDAALLFERVREGMVGRAVVDVDPEIAIDRLVRFRGFSEADARARVSKQMSREERIAAADFVVDNSKDETALDGEVARMWAWIQTLPDSPEPSPDDPPLGAARPPA